MKYKYIVLIMDGAADLPIEELNNKTPLQVANKPNIDYLTKIGCSGMFKTIPDDFITDSGVANLSILGYDPKKVYTGRGVLEAYSNGIELKEGEIAFRCNFINVYEGKIKSYSAGYISKEESIELIDFLNKKLGNERVKFYSGLGFKNILILKNDFSEEIKCYPPHDYQGYEIEKIMVEGKTEKGKKTAKFLNDLIIDSNKYLENHPVNLKREKEGKEKANYIWPWSPGRKANLEKFYDKFRIKGSIISAVDLIKGIGKMIGFEVINVPGATGLWNTNYEGKAKYAIDALKNHDFVYVHVEGIDEASHDGNLELKIKCIEDFDRRLVRIILENIDMKSHCIAVLPDHYTPVKIRSHKQGYVPFSIYSPEEKPDNVERFDEESCKSGKFGYLEKDQFIKTLLKQCI
ncbi:MAG: cofactor-independent phosphoglycerate mutase [Candidatus Omnitrophica bacterium]|nr:cofactor-independent phosphoglycerate mutase [Candidatus Omnitrophota bacterium]MCM8808554.1 cofactor-independent phosphoglycerate mutase [Candidatus Omnitrophota bacterium]